ncbi:hypothetical protein EJ110_NYTH16694 [Nymphaea thermarum]|nr:hypothetical protein EJ110_NYTH16694 [Nymphaea thermarum]
MVGQNKKMIEHRLHGGKMIKKISWFGRNGRREGKEEEVEEGKEREGGRRKKEEEGKGMEDEEEGKGREGKEGGFWGRTAWTGATPSSASSARTVPSSSSTLSALSLICSTLLPFFPSSPSLLAVPSSPLLLPSSPCPLPLLPLFSFPHRRALFPCFPSSPSLPFFPSSLLPLFAFFPSSPSLLAVPSSPSSSSLFPFFLLTPSLPFLLLLPSPTSLLPPTILKNKMMCIKSWIYMILVFETWDYLLPFEPGQHCVQVRKGCSAISQQVIIDVLDKQLPEGKGIGLHTSRVELDSINKVELELDSVNSINSSTQKFLLD